MRPYRAAISALALLAVFSLAFAAPGAQAAVDSSSYGYVWLLDNGADKINESTDWKVYVEVPAGLHVDAEEWVFDVYALYVNNSGLGADAALKVTMTIDDGVATLTKTATINAVATETGKQYAAANITFASPNATLAAAEDATWTVTLDVDAAPADVATGTCDIFESKETAALVSMMPMITGVIVAAGMIGVLAGMLKKIKV